MLGVDKDASKADLKKAYRKVSFINNTVSLLLKLFVYLNIKFLPTRLSDSIVDFVITCELLPDEDACSN